MIIRKARLADVPGIVELWKDLAAHHRQFKSVQPFAKLKPDAPRIMDSYIKKLVRSRNALVLVSEENNRLEGYAICHIKKSAPIFTEKRFGYVSDLYIKKVHRGKGVSSAFMKGLVAWLKKNKIRQLEITIWWGNSNAQDVYKKWGLREFELKLRKRL